MAVNDLGNLFLYGTFISPCNSIYRDAPKFLNIPTELTIVLGYRRLTPSVYLKPKVGSTLRGFSYQANKWDSGNNYQVGLNFDDCTCHCFRLATIYNNAHITIIISQLKFILYYFVIIIHLR